MDHTASGRSALLRLNARRLIGHHFSISAFCHAASASGDCCWRGTGFVREIGEAATHRRIGRAGSLNRRSSSRYLWTGSSAGLCQPRPAGT
jgi:hypothetical protein